MSAKHKVFKHLNSIYQLNIPLDAKIKVVKDINELAVGAFRWIVTEGEYEHVLGSQYSLKTLAVLIDSGDKLIIVKTNNDYLRVTSGTANLECFNEIRHLIHNPNKVNLDNYFSSSTTY